MAPAKSRMERRPSRADASGMRPSAWRWYLAAAAAASLAAGVVPHRAADTILVAVIASALVAGAAGVRAYRPERLKLWLLLGSTWVWWAAAASGAFTGGPGSSTGALVSIEFLPAYAFLVAAAVSLLRATGHVPLGRADTTIALLALTAVVWPLALEPNIQHPGSLDHVGVAATVAADLVVLALLLRISFTPTVRLTAFRLVLVAMAVTTVGDVVNGSPALAGPVAVRAVHAIYALAFALGGAAALHRSMRDIPLAASPASDPSHRRSVAILSAALLSPFAGTALNVYVEHEADLKLFLAFGAVIAVVALAKMSRLFRRIDALRAAAEASEQKFRMVFDSAGIGMSIGAGGMLTETNEAYRRMLDYTAEEMKEMHYTQITHPEDVDLDTAIAAEVAAGIQSSYSVEKRCVRRDGEIVWVNVTVTSAEDGSFGIGLIEDISARRRLEQERKALLARTVEVAEVERMALAADLHDGPIQHLTAVTLTLDLLANKLARGETAGATALAQRLRESIAAEMHSLRRLMTELRPPILDEGGLEAALRDCADVALDGADVGFTLQSNLDGYRLAPEIETSIYRVVREALTNVRNHAGRCEARVAVNVGARTIVLTVADDGVGFTGNGSRGHYGLVTMRERIESMDGTWQLHAAPGKGTTIRAVLPRRLRTGENEAALAAAAATD